MTFDEYWQALIKKNPALGKADEETVTLRVRGLRSIVRQAYEKGHEQTTQAQKDVGGALFDRLFPGAR